MKCSDRVFTKVCVWILILATLIPAPLMAQTLGGSGFPSLGVPGVGGSGAKDLLPGSPVMTNPTALQPLTPPQTPCPAPAPKTPLAIAPTGPTLNDFWPADSAAVLPPSADTRIRLERDERFKKEQREEVLKQKQDSLTADVDVRSKQEREERARLAQQTAQLTSKDYSVEEAFAQFSVLQNVKSRLHQFGYDFFDTQATSFAPVPDAPVGPDYVIGPLDSLSIHIWNVPEQSLNRSYIVPVERDGTIVIPQIGTIPVGGLSFSQTEKAITNRLSAHLKRFEVHVAMARLRTLKVYVVGEVVRPGAYEVGSLASISNALYAACGPSRTGSLRQIKLVRDNQVVAEVDFYQFLMFGDRRHDARLQAGDVILVPPLGPIAAVSGAVKRAAIYELKPGTRLNDLLQLAGGVTPSANLQRCQLLRLDPDKGRIMTDIDLSQIVDTTGKKPAMSNGANATMQDGDFLRVGSLPTQVVNVVTLAGAVKNSGPYEFRPGMAVRDILKPDQLTVDAYMDKAEIVRTDPLTYETKVISFSPKALFDNEKADDIPLQRMDQIVVGTQMRPPSVVFVEGEVRRPGYFTLETGETLSSVLRRAGGLTPTSFPEGIVLVRESVRKRQQLELDRFLAAERQRLTAQSASIAAGTVGMSPVGGAAAGQAAEQQVLSLRLQQLEAVTARVELGRVVINVRSIEELEGSEDDVPLEAKDRISIPQPPKTVSVIGSVKNPSTVVYRVGLNLDDYVHQAGGMTEDASKGEMYVVKANGSTEGTYIRVKDMKPGDTIVIPQKIEAKTPQLSLWQSVASIVGSVALAAAGIAVIGR